jgi:hypothetical protein
VIIGQIITVAFASGLNLYLTVAVLGAGSRLQLLPALPPGLQGIQNSFVIASALALYLIEFIIDKVPHADSAWDALHTVIRPLGTSLLVLLAFQGSKLELQAGLAVLALFVALGAHGTKALFRLLANRSPSKLRSVFISTLEDLCAVALAAAALLFPAAAPFTGAVVVLILLVLGPRLRRAAGLVVRAVSARMRALFGDTGFRSVDELPRRVRKLIETPPIGSAKPRAMRAALKGMPGVPAYRHGWVVLTADRTRFFYQGWIRWRSKTIPPLSEPRLRRGVWTDAVQFRLNKRRRCTVFLLKDGPAVEAAVAGLTGDNRALVDPSFWRPARE